MSPGWHDILLYVLTPITVAVIGGAAAVLPSLLKNRRQAVNQHDATMAGLGMIQNQIHHLDEKITAVATKVDQHLGQHSAPLRSRPRAASR